MCQALIRERILSTGLQKECLWLHCGQVIRVSGISNFNVSKCIPWDRVCSKEPAAHTASGMCSTQQHWAERQSRRHCEPFPHACQSSEYCSLLTLCTSYTHCTARGREDVVWLAVGIHRVGRPGDSVYGGRCMWQ